LAQLFRTGFFLTGTTEIVQSELRIVQDLDLAQMVR
jgi:hypothetical protein